MNGSRTRSATVLALCITEFAAFAAFVVPGTIGLQLRVAGFHDSLTPESRLSWVTTWGGIAALVAGPLFGWLSDRTARRHGHRGYWVLGGVVVGLGFVVVAANATTLPVLVLSWMGVQASYSATFAALYASISDFVKPSDRSRVVGLFAGSGIASVALGGGVAALLLSGNLGVALEDPKAVFVVMAIVAVPAGVFTSWHLRSLGRAAGPATVPVRPSGFVRLLVRAGAPFWWLLAQRLLVQLTYSCMTVYAVLYLVRRTGDDPHDAGQLVAVVTTIGGTVGVLVAMGGARFLARAIGYRAAMSVGIAILLAGATVMAFTADTPAFVAAHLCAGTGLGIYLSLDLVVALPLLTGAAEGQLLGYFATARKAAQSLIPAIGPTILAFGSGDITGADRSQNYYALMAFGALAAIVALGLAARLRVPDAVS